jgi:hypothetical protein
MGYKKEKAHVETGASSEDAYNSVFWRQRMPLRHTKYDIMVNELLGGTVNVSFHILGMQPRASVFECDSFYADQHASDDLTQYLQGRLSGGQF